MRDLRDDHDALAHVIRSCRLDVLCLQEASRRRLLTHRLRRLARETALVWVAGGPTSGGTAVLVDPRLDVLACDAQRLPVGGVFTRSRGFAMARVAAPGQPALTVVSVHLPLRLGERLDHCQRVLARLEDLGDPPSVVLGDLNEPPGGPSWLVLAAKLRDAGAASPGGTPAEPTFPAREPRRRIDAALVSSDVQVRSVHVVGRPEGLDDEVLAAASDHRPLLAVVEPVSSAS